MGDIVGFPSERARRVTALPPTGTENPPSFTGGCMEAVAEAQEARDEALESYERHARDAHDALGHGPPFPACRHELCRRALVDLGMIELG